MTNEDFYESAIRHWIGGCILDQSEEYDSAVCLYGFAAECALKMIMQRVNNNGNVRKYSHFGEALFQDITMMLSGDMVLAGMADPAWGLRLSSMHLPDILFRDHSERRYFKDHVYSKADAGECRAAAEHLIRETASLCLDGYI